MPVSPDPSWLAPTPLYIVLAITLTTSSWLLAPRHGHEVDYIAGYVALGFMVLQVGHIVWFEQIQDNYPLINMYLHWITLLLYLLGTYGLLQLGWFRLLSSPPVQQDWPDDDDEEEEDSQPS